MFGSVVNNKELLNVAIGRIDNVLKALTECESNMLQVINDLEDNWKDDKFKSDKEELSNILNNMNRGKEEIKDTLRNAKVISDIIEEYLKS